jgi:hypothetical protein
MTEFCLLAKADVIKSMQTIGETRRQRLSMLIQQHGSIATLNEALGLARTDATLSQIRNKSVHSKTGTPRAMGDELARRIEARLDLPEGWMDTPPSYAEIHGENDAISKAVAVMESMDAQQRYQALRLLDAIAEPEAPLKTGTTNT